MAGTRQKNFNFFFKKSLPSAMVLALGKVPSFAECRDHSTRQIWDLSQFCPVVPSFAECYGCNTRQIYRKFNFFYFCFPSHIFSHYCHRQAIHIYSHNIYHTCITIYTTHASITSLHHMPPSHTHPWQYISHPSQYPSQYIYVTSIWSNTSLSAT